jgi:hypothetical protein
VHLESDLFTTAAHEAGRAIVARTLGLRVTFLELAADGSGKSSIELVEQVPVLDQIAICIAGIQGVKLLGAKEGRQAENDLKIYELLKAHPEMDREHLLSEGCHRAAQILRDQRPALHRVAARLWRKRYVDQGTLETLIRSV